MEDRADGSEASIRQAMQHAVSVYIAERRARVPHFVRVHFSLRGALRLYRKGIGADLYKVPLNLLWVWPRLLARLLSSIAMSVGLKGAAAVLNRFPAGFETAVQRELTWLVYTELLEVPFRDGRRESANDAFLEAILNQPEMTAFCRPYVAHVRERHDDPELRASLAQNFREFCHTRDAASDMPRIR